MEGSPSCSKHGPCRDCQRETRKAAKEAAKEARKAMPRRPKSAYVFFVQHVRNFVQQENPGLNFPAITHEVAQRWKSLSNIGKRPYEIMAADARERYENEMIVYNNTQLPQVIEQPPPRLPQVIERLQPPPRDKDELPPREEGEETDCVVCLDNERTYAIVPCGHLCVCGGCVGRVKECPICRGRIQSILKIYF